MTAAHLWSRRDTARLLRVPNVLDDKYSRGVVGFRTGSARYPGAAVLGVEGAWRSGAGLVRYLGDEAPRALVLARRPETVITAGRVGAWVIGSGTDATHRTPSEAEQLREILAGGVPVVIDAGALDLAPAAQAPMIVTPHAGEFARLRVALGLAEAPNVISLLPRADRIVLVAEAASALGATVLLKGAETIIATSEGTVFIVESRSSWLATAGTGDVLAGMIGALISANPGATLAEAAAAAAWLHSEAAALAAGVRDGVPGHPIVALDVAEAVPAVVGEVLAQ